MANTHRNPLQVLREARAIAEDHGMAVVEEPTTGGTHYVVYRGIPELQDRIGARAGEREIRALVCELSGFR